MDTATAGQTNRNEEVFRFMVYVYRRLRKPFEDSFRTKFTSLQLNALCTLFVGGPRTMTELSGIMRIPKQQMTKLVEKLVEEGHIVRAYDSADRRKILISVSEGTAKEISRGWASFQKEISEKLEQFSQSDYDEFIGAVRVINGLSRVL